ncbi:hypothetical protein BGZ57DRAFT_456428 [Hyaloscypha finlandica]|nr:hypothetical protein BGZ57DRAFT_456428 [Hyaloscypha finlandica]
MATHYGYTDPTQGQSPVSLHPFLQESRSAWPARMDFERTHQAHQSFHAFEAQPTSIPRSLSPQGAYGSSRMTSGPEIIIDGIAARPPPLIERDVSTLGSMSRELAIHHHDHPLARVPRRSPPSWGTSRYRQQQNQRYRRFNHLPPTLRIPEPSYDPRRQTAYRETSQDPRRRSPDPRYPPSRNRPSPPLSSRWPASAHDLRHSTSINFSHSRRYSPYPPPGHRRRRSSSDRRRPERRTSSPGYHHRPEREREPSFQPRRQEIRERGTPSVSAVNA